MSRIAAIVGTAAVLLCATAAQAAAPILQPRNIGLDPGSAAFVAVNVKAGITYSITAKMGDEQAASTFAVRKTDALARRACRAFPTDDVTVTLRKTELWEFTVYAQPPRCRASHIEFSLDVITPPSAPPGLPLAEPVAYDVPLSMSVRRGKKLVASGRYTVHYHWDETAVSVIWEDDVDNFFNICLKGTYELFSKNGKLYCLLPDPSWYVTISRAG